LLEIFLLRTLKRKYIIDFLVQINENQMNYNKVKNKARQNRLVRIGKHSGLVKITQADASNNKYIVLTDIGKIIFQFLTPFVEDIKKINLTDIGILDFFFKNKIKKINQFELVKSLSYCKKTISNHINILLEREYLFLENNTIVISKKAKDFFQNLDKISDILFEKSNFKHSLPEIHLIIMSNLIEAGILHVLRHVDRGRTSITNLCRSLYLSRDTILRVLKKMKKNKIIHLSNDNNIVSSNDLTELYQLTLDIIVVSDLILKTSKSSIPKIRGLILAHLQKLIDIGESSE